MVISEQEQGVFSRGPTTLSADRRFVSGLRLPALVLLVSWLATVAYVTYLYSRGWPKILGYIPDDSFYYLQMARMLLRTGVVSVDGFSPTDGYHPLWFLIVTGLTALRHGYLHILAVQSALHFLGIFVIVALLRRKVPTVSPLLTTFLFVLYPTLWVTSFNGLETSVFVLMLALNLYHVAVADFKSQRAFALQGLLFGLVFLARTDSVFLIFALSVVVLLRTPRDRSIVRRALPGVIVCAAVVSPWLIYCQLKFGSIVQGSGKIFFLYDLRYFEFHHMMYMLNPHRRGVLGLILTDYTSQCVGASYTIFYAALAGALIILYRSARRGVPEARTLLPIMLALIVYIVLMICANAWRLTWREWYAVPSCLLFVLSLSVMFCFLARVPACASLCSASQPPR